MRWLYQWLINLVDPPIHAIPNDGPPDEYDKAIAYLTEHPNEIGIAWAHPGTMPGGCLFNFVPGFGAYGCLTMIRGGQAYNARTEELTNAIRNDKRLPSWSSKVRVKHLPVFAEWQRRLDKDDADFRASLRSKHEPVTTR
jgi:hypothetical protein